MADQPAGDIKEPVSGEDEVVVFLINPVTGDRKRIIVEKSAKNRTRMKSGVNKFEIKRWIQERCPIPYPAI